MLNPLGQRAMRWLSREHVGAALAIVAIAWVGCIIYARVVDHTYAIRHWLLWDVAKIWSYVALWNVACASFGQLVLVRGLGVRGLAPLASAVLSMTVGVVAFTLAMYIAGALEWYTGTFAIVLPLLMAACSATHGVRLGRQLWSELTEARRPTLLSFVLHAAGVVCVGIVYLGVFSPDALNYDSGWSHMVVAQDYARAGRIVPFPADYNKNVPQLASLIYTWCYLLPGLPLAPRWMLALHSEFSLFLWTLASVAALIRAVFSQAGRGTWISFFLFPIIFVYDNNLGGAADHVCGFFSGPIALATLLAVETFSRGRVALLAICCAGALLTKYQAVFAIAPAGLVFAGCWLWQLAKHRGDPATRAPTLPLRDLAWAPAILAGLGLALFAPHMLRQLIFHHNPLYPLLQDSIASTPTVPNAAFLLSNALADPLYQPAGSLWNKLVHAVKLLFTFSFVPHYSFSRDWPAFGSLFTLLLPALVFVPERRRLSLLAAHAVGAVLAWALVYHIDRNLQVVMPILVAVTGALVAQIWRMGWPARAGLVPLLALQIAWGSDALFYSQWSRIDDAMYLIRSGHEGRGRRRYRQYRSTFIDMGKAVPPNARMLLHASHLTLGMNRDVWLDGAGFQGRFSYDHLRTARELYDYLREAGIEYLVWEPQGRIAPSRQEDVLWSSLAEGYAERIGDYGGHRLARMPSEPPPATSPYLVATLGLHGYADGLYPIEALDTLEFLPRKLQRFARPSEPMPATTPERLALLERADAVFVAGKTQPDRDTRRLLERRFKFTYGGEGEFNLMLKRDHFDARQAKR